MDFVTYQYLLKYSIFKPGALKLYRNAIKNQYLSEKELSELSWLKTKKLLKYAFENVPWYKNRFTKIGLNPKDITESKYFTQIPVLSREELVENYELFFSQKVNPKSLKISTTGGSTGKPLKVGMQKYGIREVQKWQMYSWWGLTPEVNMASLYREVEHGVMKRWALNFINWPQKEINLDATNMTKEKIEEFINRSNKIKPHLIHGYVGAVDSIANYLLKNEISFPIPKVVWLTAAPINAIQEEKISKAFKAPVCDQYGCSERYFIAAECPHKEGLHIFVDSVKVEILGQNNELAQPMEYGKIVLTNLDEFHFPLIRYENGDEGRMLNSKCKCGMTLPLMDKVKGRVSDNIVLPDGTVLAGEYLTTIFDNYTEEVDQFQIIQKKDKMLQINIVIKKQKYKNTIIDWTEKELQIRIKNQVKLSINIVEEIQQVKGKLQFIIKEQ